MACVSPFRDREGRGWPSRKRGFDPRLGELRQFYRLCQRHGFLGATKNADLEHAASGLRGNSVGPGFILTPLVADSLDEATLKFLESKHALKRLGRSEEVAALIVFLLSDRASFITGSYHLVDGGYTAQ